MKINHHTTIKQQRRKRVRGKLFGTAKRPRLSVFRSNKHIYLQAINDQKGVTIAAVGDTGKGFIKGSKIARAQACAKKLALKLKKKKINQLVFDRGHYRFHGRVKQTAMTLKEQGLKL
jgi:large subunit ribosomal protein L18